LLELIDRQTVSVRAVFIGESAVEFLKNSVLIAIWETGCNYCSTVAALANINNARVASVISHRIFV
jgi:hypothetical protein